MTVVVAVLVEVLVAVRMVEVVIEVVEVVGVISLRFRSYNWVSGIESSSVSNSSSGFKKVNYRNFLFVAFHERYI